MDNRLKIPYDFGQLVYWVESDSKNYYVCSGYILASYESLNGTKYIITSVPSISSCVVRHRTTYYNSPEEALINKDKK